MQELIDLLDEIMEAKGDYHIYEPAVHAFRSLLTEFQKQDVVSKKDAKLIVTSALMTHMAINSDPTQGE